MLISKKQICKLFFDYTKLIYKECGRPLSKKQEMILKNRLEKKCEEYTIKNQVKAKLCKKANS